MPRKSVPGKVTTFKTVDSADDLWVAPRPARQKPPRTYAPVSGTRLNRYLEFADIALGVKRPGTRRKKSASNSLGQSGQKALRIL